MKPDVYYRGTLLDIFQKGMAHVQIRGSEWGPTDWKLNDQPYGKDKVGHWYFVNPHPEALALLETLGVELGDKDHIPSWQSADPPKATSVVSPEFVQTVVEGALEKHRDHSNGDHLSRTERVGATSNSKASKKS